MTDDEQLTRFSKAREQIVGRVKGTESKYVQGPQSSEEYLVVMERVPSRTDIPSVREPSPLQLGLPQKIGVLEQMTILFL